MPDRGRRLRHLGGASARAETKITTIAGSQDAPHPGHAACECHRRTEVVSPRISGYMGGHLAPICRLSATETEWYCLYTLIHWVWYEDAHEQEILYRMDPAGLMPFVL